MAKLSKVQTDHRVDPDAFKAQEKQKIYAEELRKNQLAVGTMLDVEFDDTKDSTPLVRQISHKLGRVPEGWFVAEIRPKLGIAAIREYDGTNDKKAQPVRNKQLLC